MKQRDVDALSALALFANVVAQCLACKATLAAFDVQTKRGFADQVSLIFFKASRTGSSLTRGHTPPLVYRRWPIADRGSRK